MENALIETQDGSHSLLSGVFGVSYHSRYGAIQESSHVFIQAGLHWKALQSKQLRILEIGFGTGLNAYLTLLETQRLDLKVHYESIEAFPISIEQAAALNYPQILEPEPPTLFMKLHAAPFGSASHVTTYFHLLKRQISFHDIQYSGEFDLVYYDAFAPDAQPELWEEPMLKKIYEALKPGGIMVTYCAKGYVKRNLKAVGFQVDALPGPPGKREMTRCLKS
ncbi:MAG: tRNA (5-methylaminomethyl-2-thiouridine)(34)-methyltransferase MnmD [Saprospiraceae bacterium]